MASISRCFPNRRKPWEPSKHPTIQAATSVEPTPFPAPLCGVFPVDLDAREAVVSCPMTQGPLTWKVGCAPVLPAVGQTTPDPGGPQCPFRVARNVGVQEFAQF